MTRARSIALGALLLAACKGPGASAPTDGADVIADLAAPAPGGASLRLTIQTLPPQVDGLVISGGQLELLRPSLFGDVAADSRTMLNETELGLPSAAHDASFPMAPYGLYSRAQFSIDEARAYGTWQGAPLSLSFEAATTKVNLPGPTLDYEPGTSAHFLITLDVGAWLNGATLGGLEPAGDGTIHVDATDPSAVATSVVALQKSFALTTAP